jgi:hypothetical protein
MIIDKGDMLDADPFVYGANKYNIIQSVCFIDQETTLEFNKTGSKFIIRSKKEDFGEWLD